MKKANEKVSEMAVVEGLKSGSVDEVPIKDEFKELLKVLDNELFRAKMELSNVSLRAAMLEAERQQALGKTFEADKRLVDKVREIAQAMGVDLEKSSWTVDIPRMIFVRRTM